MKKRTRCSLVDHHEFGLRQAKMVARLNVLNGLTVTFEHVDTDDSLDGERAKDTSASRACTNTFCDGMLSWETEKMGSPQSCMTLEGPDKSFPRVTRKLLSKPGLTTDGSRPFKLCTSKEALRNVQSQLR